MIARAFIQVGLGLALSIVGRAQTAMKPGYYEISSGQYVECCGIAGEFSSALPNDSQSFIKLTLPPDSATASMAILAKDMQTVFAVTYICVQSQTAPFDFNGGLVFPDHIIFHVDPGPGGLYWNYTLSNSPPRITLDGVLAFATSQCADTLSRFSHTNVVAVWVPPPNIEVKEYATDGPVLFIQGRAGWQTVVEASTDLRNWVEIDREVMPATFCPICPYIEVHDTAGMGKSDRYYRCYQIP
jgi:hypothetical protein